ncbi:FixH family protein [Deinococcus planocerae]|uniref:FixH family protein n=1 Tax=Deinococcus planocerae TaxID=1737569 RepID=UPI0015E082F6|nr:FixH family protein [Deinococcus planocerae]
MPTRPPTPRFPFRVGVLALGLTLGACRAPAARDVDVRLTTRPDPARVGPTRLDLTLGMPVTSVRVEGNMTHAGMAPVRAQAMPAGNGRYVVDAFDFNMAGDWVVTVTARAGDGRTLTTDVPLTVAAP